MKYFIIMLSSFFLIACQSSITETMEDSISISEENSRNHAEESLKLNHNEKWTVVPEMMNYIQYMKEDVAKFKGTTLEESQALSTDLLINIDLLTAKCTMKGEAHDQLHLWLLPYIDLVNDFANATTIKDANIEFNKIKTSFLEFDIYFE